MSALGTLVFGAGLVAALGRRQLRRRRAPSPPDGVSSGARLVSTEAWLERLGRERLARLMAEALAAQGFRRAPLPVGGHGLFDGVVEDGRKRIAVVVVPAPASPTPELVRAAASAGRTLGLHVLVVAAGPCSRSLARMVTARSLGLWDLRRLAREVDRVGLGGPDRGGLARGGTAGALRAEVVAGLAALGRAVVFLNGWAVVIRDARTGGKPGASGRRR